MHDPERYRPTERFGNRVADYAQARPGYPPALTQWLIREAGLAKGAIVADIGSGTGLFTRELLAAGLQVHAVEPNAPMRAEAERVFAGRSAFASVDGTAEATGLPDASVQLVTAAQAYHWFVPEAARAEALRILVPDGHAALIWNVRRLDSRFAQDYEALLMSHCPDYSAGQPHQASPREMAVFFGARAPMQKSFAHTQAFDFEKLRQRLFSSSYTPAEGDPARAQLAEALASLFARHQENGRVSFEYDARIYLARLGDGD